MGNYLKGETPSTIYKQLLSVGGSADRVGLTASLKDVWTDDGAGSKNLAPFQLSTAALSFSTTKQLQFRDTAIYLNSSTDGQLDIVADTEVQVTTAAFDVNASGAVTIDGSSVGVTGTTTLNSATTVSGALTCSSTTALNGITTLGSGIALRFADSGEYISGDGTNLTLGSGADINLTATSDINVPQDVGITFGDDGEKIEGDGTNLAVTSSGALNMTGAAASTWKTTSGLINIDSEDSTVEIDGHGGVNIVGNAAEVDITTTGALDLNSGAFTLDGAGISIDGTDDSNITVTGSSKDLSIAVVGGGTQQLTLASAGTGANAIDVEASAGGIDIRATGAASGEDIDITATGSSINLTSTENVSDAIVLNASAGGIDITSSGSAGEDIDISTSSSINLTSTENAANALYLRANGGTSETIKIHADQGTGDDSIYLLSDAGGISIESGKTGAITNMSSDSLSSLTNAVIRIGTDTANCDIAIGHSTSDVHFGQHVKIAGDLHVVGSVPSADSLSAGTIARFTMTNTDEENAVGGRDSELLFKGESASGTAHEMAAITVMQQTEDQYYSKMVFRLNDSTSGASLAATGSTDDVLTLTYDKTATFGGAIAAGTNAITCGQLNADNVRLDGNTLSTQDTDGDLTIAPNGNGGVVFFSGTASGNDAIAWNGGTASGASTFSGGGAGTSSGDYSFQWGTNSVTGSASAAFGLLNTVSGLGSFAMGTTNSNAGNYSLALGRSNETTTSVTGQLALGQYSKTLQTGEFAISSGTISGTTAGSAQGNIIHTAAEAALSGTATKDVSGGSDDFTLPSNAVATGTAQVVITSAGAAKTIGFVLHFLVQNDGGTEAVTQQSLTSLDTEDTDFTFGIAATSSGFKYQFSDSSTGGGTYAVNIITTLSQVTYA